MKADAKQIDADYQFLIRGEGTQLPPNEQEERWASLMSRVFHDGQWEINAQAASVLVSLGFMLALYRQDFRESRDRIEAIFTHPDFAPNNPDIGGTSYYPAIAMHGGLLIGSGEPAAGAQRCLDVLESHKWISDVRLMVAKQIRPILEALGDTPADPAVFNLVFQLLANSYGTKKKIRSLSDEPTNAELAEALNHVS